MNYTFTINGITKTAQSSKEVFFETVCIIGVEKVYKSDWCKMARRWKKVAKTNDILWHGTTASTAKTPSGKSCYTQVKGTDYWVMTDRPTSKSHIDRARECCSYFGISCDL